MNLPKWARVKHLHQKDRDVYEHISNYGGSTWLEVNSNFDNYADVQITNLKNYELIYDIEGKLYAYWHKVVKELGLEGVSRGQNNISKW